MDELDLTSYTVDDLLALWDSAGPSENSTAKISEVHYAISKEIARRWAKDVVRFTYSPTAILFRFRQAHDGRAARKGYYLDPDKIAAARRYDKGAP